MCNSTRNKSLHSDSLFIDWARLYFLIRIKSVRMVRSVGLRVLSIFPWIFLSDVHVASGLSSTGYSNYYTTNHTYARSSPGQKRIFDDSLDFISE